MWNLGSLSSLRDRYHILTAREKTAAGVASLAVLFFLLFQFIYTPINRKLTSFETSIQNKEKELLELKSLISEYELLKQMKGKEGNAPVESLSLFSILEKLATQIGLMEKIEYMRPGSNPLNDLNEEKWVEVKLNQISLKDLANYLYSLQAYRGSIYIKRLSIRKDGDQLNLILQPAVIESRTS